MTEVAEQIQYFLEGFDEAVFNQASCQGAALLKTKREEAFAAYAALPNPGSRDEEYRRTDPMMFRFGRYTRMPTVSRKDDFAAGAWDEQFDVVVEISDTNVGIKDLSGVLSDEVVVTTLDEAAENHAEVISEYLQGAASPETPRKFFELANAFWNAGLFVHLKKGQVLEKGILVRYRYGQEGSAAIPRLLVVAEAETQATIVEHYSASPSGHFLCVGAREFYVDQAAHIKCISMQEWGSTAVHIGEDWARVKRDATVDLVTMSLGGKVSKSSVGCDVCEPNSNAYLGGLYFANAKQHFDQMTLQMHSAPDTYSNMLYKGAAKDEAYSVYQGVIRATHGSIGVDAYQTNNNLVLDKGARADSMPGLIINADDLACSHGATMGNLDPEQIYYLRSRGISEAEARKMLVLGFFEEIVERVPHEPIQDRLHALIEENLGCSE